MGCSALAAMAKRRFFASPSAARNGKRRSPPGAMTTASQSNTRSTDAIGSEKI